jgi:hypothetical protein
MRLNFSGSPEGELAGVQACLYCHTPRESTPPMQRRNPHGRREGERDRWPALTLFSMLTKLINISYGAGYTYDHNAVDGFSGAVTTQRNGTAGLLPTSRARLRAQIRERLEYWESGQCAEHELERFQSFIAIDWSGAAGERHKGIALAQCDTGDAPSLVRPDHKWSRADVLDYLSHDRP